MKITYVESGKYQADFRDHTGRRCRPVIHADNKKAALTEARRLQREGIEPQDQTPRAGLTVREGLSRLYDSRYAGGKSAKTIRSSMLHLEQSFGGSTVIKTITVQDIDTLVLEWRNGGLAAATINRRLAVLSVLFKYAVDAGAIKTFPRIKKLREQNHRTRVVSGEEELTLLGLSSPHQYRELWKVLLDTGMRIGEVLGLQRQPFSQEVADERAARGLFSTAETDGEKIKIWDSKGGKPRTIPCTGAVRYILERRIKCYPQLLFPYSYKEVILAWDRVKVKMGLEGDPQFVPHCLRHTCATRLYERTGDVYLVKEWLGHSSILTTQRYAHMSADKMSAAVTALESPEMDTNSRNLIAAATK